MKSTTYRFSFTLLTGLALACTTPKTDDPAPNHSSSGGKRRPSVTITTVVGGDTKAGNLDGKGTAARFSYPSQMTVDKNENLYVIDQRYSYTGGSVIRRIDPAGNVTTFTKGLYSITDICVDPRDGVTLYAIESGDAQGVASGIFRISADGKATRLNGGSGLNGYEDGPLATAKFYSPRGIAMDITGNLYIADALNYCVRKVNLSTSTVTTLAGKAPVNTALCNYGDGQGKQAEFCTFEDLTLDEAGNVYVPDWGNRRVRKITPDGTVSTYINFGTGYGKDCPRSQATVFQPYRTHYDPASRQLFIVDDTGGSLDVVTPDEYVYSLSHNTVSTDYAENRPGFSHGIFGIAVNQKGDVFILDKFNHCIRKATIRWN
ncbi:hypothetical protein [Larkinella humicola]|uniref:NHL repeat-containing protein n=1 Tax=Larkinella humicola TaxID=2607654 RepID=A0A5N1JN12_9BACT|nr:hypothetical protein [Larkinella humicola]KAA9357654.1 hypothetical protein F0P93_07970 [Larkinella humicola]